jgi:hypothetical protein
MFFRHSVKQVSMELQQVRVSSHRPKLRCGSVGTSFSNLLTECSVMQTSDRERMSAGLQSKYKLLKSSSYSILKAHKEREAFWGDPPLAALQHKAKLCGLWASALFDEVSVVRSGELDAICSRY